MHSFTNKTQGDKRKAIWDSTSGEQSNQKLPAQFTDYRPEAIMYKELQDIANNSQEVKHLQAFQEMANNHTARIAQRKEDLEEETLLKEKHEPIQKKENNTRLPDNLKAGIESISGYSMDDVKVHYNSTKPSQLNALAYTQGNDIHLGPGQEKYLPHEAWHNVQQKQRRVQPTALLKGRQINDDANLEKEADLMGVKSLQTQKKQESTFQFTGSRLKLFTSKIQQEAADNSPQVNRAENFQQIANHPKEIKQLQTQEPPDNQPGRLIVNNEAEPGQIQKDAFLLKLKTEIVRIAEEILSQIGQTASDCPYIAYWFSYYADKDPAHIEQAIRRYAPETSEATTYEELIDLLAARVKLGFQKHVSSGTLEGVPDELPKNLHEPEGEKPADIIQRCKGGAAEARQPNLIFGESHSDPTTRTHIRNNLEAFASQGYRYLAIELDGTQDEGGIFLGDEYDESNPMTLQESFDRAFETKDEKILEKIRDSAGMLFIGHENTNDLGDLLVKAINNNIKIVCVDYGEAKRKAVESLEKEGNEDARLTEFDPFASNILMALPGKWILLVGADHIPGIERRTGARARARNLS